MPRNSLFVCILLVLFNCSSKKADKKPLVVKSKPKTTASHILYIPNPDTLAIENEMANQPFLTDTISLEAIKFLFKDQYKISKKPVPNKFVKNQTDTLITIRKGNSYIRLYAVSQEDKYFYEAAEILDAFPVFQKSIRVGQSKQDIARVFPALAKTKTIPDYIEISAGEGADFLYLVFQNNKLKKVNYHPYLD